MARRNFGGDLASFLYIVQDSTAQYGAGTKVARLTTGSTVVTFYTAITAGTQITDLLLNGGAVTSITADANSTLPVFQGPDAVVSMWADANAGAGPRRLMVCTDIASTTVLSVFGRTGDVVGTSSDVGADPSGTSATAMSTHLAASDPHGDRAYANGIFRPVIEYNTGSSTWPLRATSPADQSKRFEWFGPVGAAAPTTAGYMAEGDILELAPA